MVTTEVMNKERLDRYILEAAKASGYEDGFGTIRCDLNCDHWWVSYTRQSTREQAENDRLGEYLLTCARLAKQNGGVVPREYVVYDAESSEDLNRPGMIWVRKDLLAGRHAASIVIPCPGASYLQTLSFSWPSKGIVPTTTTYG